MLALEAGMCYICWCWVGKGWDIGTIGVTLFQNYETAWGASSLKTSSFYL